MMDITKVDNVLADQETGNLIKSYFSILRSESDKGAVLVASSVFEDALKDLITARIYPSKDKRDPLFSGEGAPLFSFGAKIEMAYRLGVLSDGVREQLTIFRRLRNEFAHNIDKHSFDDPAVKDRIN
ncbi:MltR family transcriptional regulator, partial [Morganella morganii]|uniref:MltR family transcriptional regulator n=1 Tax=Morganella morganii TaxID=582 RepID=UPI0019662D3C